MANHGSRGSSANGGADDAGSTMMEENVVSASGTSKTMASEIGFRKLSSGQDTPRKRDSDYF